MVTKVKVGAAKSLEWALFMMDEQGFVLGVAPNPHKSFSRAQLDILKKALEEAAKKLDVLKAEQAQAAAEERSRKWAPKGTK